ncbi:MAG: DMT family transporter [Candidatus Dormibacteraeota bacterium]|nr:DMT family transporter [Candidatus Dormibacteraeota bacterium]
MISRRAAPLALVGATVAVSVSAILITEARTDAATVVWLRMALAVGLLAPWATPQLRVRMVGGSRRDSLLTAVAGVLLAAHFLTWTASLAYTSVAASVLLVSLHPLIVAPLGARLHGDAVSGRVIAGIVLALAGTVVTCAGAFTAGGKAFGGDLLALAGGIALAGYLLIGRSRRRLAGVAAYSAVVYAVVSVAAVSVAAAGGTLHAPSVRTLVACLGLAAVCTIGGHTVFNWTLRRLPASTVSLSFLGEPPLAALLAFLILGQRIALATIVGGALILAGLGAAVSTSTEARLATAPAG